jgi:hypothetical protein
MTKNLITFPVAILALLFVGFACKGFTEGKPAAEKAVVEFHSMLDEGRFDEIYDASDRALKDVTSREEMNKLFNAVHSKLGKVKTSTETNFQIGNYNLKTSVMLTEETIFESGKGVETFTYYVDGNNATLVGWHINSNELITN